MAEEFNVPVDMQVSIQLDVRSVQIILMSLGQQPYNSVSDLISSIRSQCDNQVVATLRRMQVKDTVPASNKAEPVAES